MGKTRRVSGRRLKRGKSRKMRGGETDKEYLNALIKKAQNYGIDPKGKTLGEIENLVAKKENPFLNRKERVKHLLKK